MARVLILSLALVTAAWPRIVGANRTLLARIDRFERRLEEESLVGRTLRPHAQWLLTAWLGVGNERVYKGRDGWLFYRPDVEYVTGRGFLERRQLATRTSSAAEWTVAASPDPLPAIMRFRDDLAARGVALVLMPTPVKPVVHPERLASRAEGSLRNTSYDGFATAVEAAGVALFDSAPLLVNGAGERYLATDTHWRPEAMEIVAEALARFISSRWPGHLREAAQYQMERAEVRNVGDIARMLDLAEDQTLYPVESVWLRRVLQADGLPWRSSRGAEVLVLGDSFSNIYSLESMGWGTSAGFVEHLSRALRRPVDRIVQNDEGAFRTRELLAQDPGRLASTRVVVYQFAERELAFGDWKVLPIRQE